MKEEDKDKNQHGNLNLVDNESLSLLESEGKTLNLIESILREEDIMGMDLVGVKSKSEKGEHFRNNLAWWPWLWRFCKEVAGDKIKIDWELGYYNDALALDENQTMQLAAILEEELADGSVKRREEEINAWNSEMSDLECYYCKGTGRRKRPPKTGAGDIFCNGCRGTGKQPFDNRVYFSEDNVRKFLEFLKNSGGFVIY